MGAKHNLPSLKNAMMDLPDVKNVTEKGRGEGEDQLGFGALISIHVVTMLPSHHVTSSCHLVK